MTHCPCCSGKLFSLCCAPFLSGKTRPRTVKQLMRSRYCAFAIGDQGNYLLQTWHAQTAPDINAEELGQRDTQWLGLEIINSSQQGDSGTVEFKASFLDENGETRVHHENSLFAREQGQWFYVQPV